MQDNDIIFHPINKTDTDKIKQSTSVFIQPIAGNYTNLYAELKEKCAPEQFMEPYDTNKVHILNDVKEAFPLMRKLADKKTFVLLENDLPDIFNE